VAPRRATFPEGPAWQPAAAALNICQRIPRVALAKIGGQPGSGALCAPLIGLAKDALAARRLTQDADRANLGRCWADTGLVFTTCTGRPVEPRNLVRSFTRICQNHTIRRIPVHGVRHTVATLLKQLKVPARDAQIILGHAHITTTRQICTHVDEAARLDALTRLNELLSGAR
jgi:integrase